MNPVILLVDDNKEILTVLSDELNDKYEVILASDGREAFLKLKESNIDLIVSDVMMPIMDGFEFCKLIKSSLEFSHIPVILLTAKNTLQSKITGLELGADAYIEKPFEIDYLSAQITSLIRNRNKLREHFAFTPLAHINSIAHTQTDESFINKFNQLIHEHIDDQDLDIEKLARYMNMSRTSLFRKIKSMADMTPNELITVTRLKKAAELLLKTVLKIYEVSYMVGYTSQTTFGRSFTKQFGISPSQYQKSRS
jgi:DNA-binding response OmpR family regulator